MSKPTVIHLILAFAMAAADAPAVEWRFNQTAAFKAAAAQQKPLFVFARADDDLQSRWIAAHVLTQPAVQEQLRRYVCAQLWVGAKALRKVHMQGVGFLFFEPNGALMSVVQGDAKAEALAAELKSAYTRVGAVAKLQAQLKQRPKDKALLAELIAEQVRRRNDTAAVRLFEPLAGIRALTEDEAAERDYLQLRLKLRAKDRAAAAKLGEQFLAKHAKSRRLPEAAMAAAAAYESSRDYDKAIDVLARALLLQPEMQEGPRIALRMAFLRRISGKVADARMTMNSLMIRWPASATAAAVALNSAKDLWLEQGKPQAAERVLSKLLSCPDAPYLVARARAMEEAIAAEARWIAAPRARPAAADVVVLVPDVATFLHYVSLWDAGRIFPVLLDAPKFARKFIDAYQPKEVLIAEPAAAAKVDESLVWRTIRAAWRPEDSAHVTNAAAQAVHKQRAAMAPRAPGVVVTSLDAAQLAGAVALAAARRQALLLAEPGLVPKRSVVSAQDKDRLRQWLAESLATRKLAYDQLGDDVDFVTVAAAWPQGYNERNGVIPGRRVLDDAITRRADGRRYAFVGRLTGDAAQAAYQAMAALFLKPKSALLFNTYGGRRGSIWRSYNMERAEAALKPSMGVTRLSAPKANLAGWYAHAFPMSRFGLVFVNSSGGRTDWSVPGGGGTTDDVPDTVPCMVHFTHSNSSGAVDSVNCIGGRWLANGAYAYYGSFAEPYLTAFVAPTELAIRLRRGWPMGAACRRLYGEPFWGAWRLWLVGDPLAAIAAAPGARIDPPRLEAKPLGEALKELTQARETARRAELTFVAGRDAEAYGYAKSCEPRSARVQYVLLAALLRQGKLAEIEQEAGGKPPDGDAGLVWRVAVAAQLQRALKEKQPGEAMKRVRVLAPVVASSKFLVRSLGALKPLCAAPEQKEAFSKLCEDLRQARPKDKRLIQGIEKLAENRGEKK